MDHVEKDDSCAESEKEEGDKSKYLSPNDNGEKYVIDGECHLRQVIWYKESLFREIIQNCLNNVGSRYGQCTVVSDSYQDGTSLKNH